ncbi:tetratricopeptide repeat protein [Micromonospora sp. BQ11]|uniref:tetratricopeptide repeat protein n=1 Tax=Micromonospora sp. BQ11 TaxID=3452212 RepID=UPI003F8C10FC
MTTTASAVARGRVAFRDGRLADAEEAFNEALADGEDVPQAVYGLAAVKLAQEDRPAAEDLFRKAYALGGDVENAAYYLGRMSFERGEMSAARAWYSLALEGKPDHAGAADGMAEVTEAEAVAAGRVDGEYGRSALGAYEALQASTDPLVRAPLTLLENLVRTASPPRISAYIGQLAAALWWAVLSGYVLVQGYYTLSWQQDFSRRPLAPSWLLVLCCFAVGASVVAVQAAIILTTRYTLAKGRIQTRRGIVIRHDHNLELYRVTNITIRRSLLQRITNDGTFVFAAFEAGHPIPSVKLVGFASLTEMRELHPRLLNLVFTLRGSNAVRGIIQ